MWKKQKIIKRKATVGTSDFVVENPKFLFNSTAKFDYIQSLFVNWQESLLMGFAMGMIAFAFGGTQIIGALFNGGFTGV